MLLSVPSALPHKMPKGRFLATPDTRNRLTLSSTFLDLTVFLVIEIDGGQVVRSLCEFGSRVAAAGMP